MNKLTIFGISIVLILIISGCWAHKSIMTAENITQPVLVGKVKIIGGKPIENSTLRSESHFSVGIVNSDYYYSSGYVSGSKIITQGSNLVDTQLLPFTDETQNDSTAMIIADQIRFNVASGYWLFVLYSGNKGYIEGAKYYGKLNKIK
jgi:hypothetical protein